MDGFDPSYGLIPDSHGTGQAAGAWAAYCTTIGVPAGSHQDAATVAAAMAAASRSEPGAAGAALALRKLTDLFGVDAGADAMAPFVSALLVALPLDALQRILQQAEVPERRSLVDGLVVVVQPGAVLRVAAAAAASYGRPLSAVLAKLLGKLRVEAETAPGALRQRADLSFRSLVQHLVSTWTAATISGAGSSYDAMFHDAAPRRVTRVTPEPLRVVQLAVESGAIGNVVWGAVAEQTRTETGMRELFEMVKHAPAGSRAAGMIVDHIATPARLSLLLREEPVDWAIVDAVLARSGASAIRPLLDELVDAKLRGTRRALMDRLVKMGPEIAPFVMERISDRRWYVVRNMISLLREAGCPVTDVPLEQFREHEDPRVRREMLQLQLDNAQTRESALAQALADPDRHVLRTALQAARSHLPESVVPILNRRLQDASFPPEFRVMSIFLLGRSGSPIALDTLLAWVSGGRSLLGQPKLAAKSPEMLAALGGLARSWSHEKRAATLLDVARKSKDDQILNALHAQPGAP